MGNSSSNTVVNHYEEIENIDDDDLDKRQKKFKQAIEIYNDIKEIKKSKCDRIMYRLPVQLCNWSIF